MRRFVLAAVLVAACGRHPSGPKDAPAPLPPGPARGSFALTYYWPAIESDETADTKIFDRSCAPVATVSGAFASALTSAGSGRLRDGRFVVVAGDCACPRSPCVRVETSRWGIGAGNLPLVPFHSLAVDRSVIPLGTHLFIEELAGRDMPGVFPELHDGCVVADDTGGRIIGDKIDLFVASEADYVDLDRALALTSVTVHDGGDRCK